MDSNSPKATEAELARMMEQYGARLVAVCALMLGDRDLAQDIVQETFIRAYQRLECFRGERQESERAWLTSIAVNLCKNERKKSWFRFIDRKTPIDALISLRRTRHRKKSCCTWLCRLYRRKNAS